MMHRWAARLLVLALCTLVPSHARSQQSGQDRTTGSALGQNYPNPFNPETRIPFTIGGYPNCADPGRQYRVSLRIYNVLAQLVAVPVLQGSTANGVAGGQPLLNLSLTCGEYTAYWDGKIMRSGREAASGIYGARLEVNGNPIMRKMTVRK